MASSGRLLGLQLPPVPSHLSDFMPACVRSTHTRDARECSSPAQLPDLPRQAPRTVLQGVSLTKPSFAGLSASTPLCFKMGADVNVSLEQSQSLDSCSSFALSCSAQQIEVVKQTGKHAEWPSLSGWAPYFSLGSNEGDVAKASHPGAEARPTTPPEVEDISGTFSKQAGENSHGQSRGFRSTLSSMQSLDKRNGFLPGHASQFMVDVSTPFTRRAPKADSKNGADILKESSVSDLSVTRGDPSWMEDKFNDTWGIEPWHSDQRNILMKALHIMRCDIESLKVILTSDDFRGCDFT